MLNGLLLIATIAWKALLIAGAAWLACLAVSPKSVRHCGNRTQLGYSALCICFAVIVFLFASVNQPFAPGFWRSWHFADDVGTFAMVYGLVTTIRVLWLTYTNSS